MERITALLQEKQNPRRAKFSASLAPSIDPDRFLGLTKSEIVQIYRKLNHDQITQFLKELPHVYFEEDLLHLHALNQIKEETQALKEVDRFLPYLNSWALTDAITLPKVSRNALLHQAECYLKAKESYTRRLGILWIMKRVFKRKKVKMSDWRNGLVTVNEEEKEWSELALHAEGHEKEVEDAKGWLICVVMIYAYSFGKSLLNDPSISYAARKTGIRKCMESLRLSDEQKQELRTIGQKITQEQDGNSR